MVEYKKIKIYKGARGYGGPLVIEPTDTKNIILYVTGGRKPKIVDIISELSGMEAVDGFKTSVADERVALAVVDCGGVLRAGIYPQKGIYTLNIMNTGKSGPLAKYIEPDIYVSGVTKREQIEVMD